MVAGIFYEIRVASIIANRKAEMMIVKTHILGDVGAGSAKCENAWLTIGADLIVTKGWLALWAIDDDAG